MYAERAARVRIRPTSRCVYSLVILDRKTRATRCFFSERRKNIWPHYSNSLEFKNKKWIKSSRKNPVAKFIFALIFGELWKISVKLEIKRGRNALVDTVSDLCVGLRNIARSLEGVFVWREMIRFEPSASPAMCRGHVPINNERIRARWQRARRYVAIRVRRMTQNARLFRRDDFISRTASPHLPLSSSILQTEHCPEAEFSTFKIRYRSGGCFTHRDFPIEIVTSSSTPRRHRLCSKENLLLSQRIRIQIDCRNFDCARAT